MATNLGAHSTTNHKKIFVASKDGDVDILRHLFPDQKSVLIFPDDFPEYLKRQKEENRSITTTMYTIMVEELVHRHQGHFSNRRVAILFRPGRYHNIHLPVGYWTQVLGLGETPKDVTFTGTMGVYAIPANTECPDVGSLDTFWRSAENFTSNCEFVHDPIRNIWCVPLPLEPSSSSSGTFLYPVGDDLTNPQRGGYPSDQVPSHTFSPQRGMLWAVSQAAPLRRISIQGNLHLSLGNHCASGGFASNVDCQYLLLGSQQQYCLRNCHIQQKAVGGAWSFVLVGCNSGGSEENPVIADIVPWAQKPGVTNPHVAHETKTKYRIEKPFLYFSNDDDQLYLGIPKLQRDSVGVNHEAMDKDTERVVIDRDQNGSSKVRVFTPQHSFVDIQTALDQQECHVVLSPGTYHWKQTLNIRTDRQVVLGIGMATIQAPNDGNPCIHVAGNVRGVRLSGLSLEASGIGDDNYDGSTLLQWGDPGRTDNTGQSDDSITEDTFSGAIHDLYCFVGGRSLDRSVKVQTMVKIYSNHVVGDNLWLWRADHVQLQKGETPNKPELSEYHVTEYGECKCDVGLQVFGHYVTMYGLAVEHTYKDLVQWYGHHGAVYFYQSELPYDVSPTYYGKNIAGYHVHAGADHHVAKGIGVYSYFRDHAHVEIDSGIIHEASMGRFESVYTVWLNGHYGLKSVINGCGEAATQPGKPYVIKKYER